MEYHEIANIFPLMEGTELTELSADIKKNGLIDPIWLYENKILDGRNRYRACQEVGVEPRFQSYPGNDPLQQVISLNLHRRHLNESQRAVVAARLANMQVGDNQYSGSANMPTLSQSQAAKMLNVSERMVRTVKAIEREAPERLSEINLGKETATKIYKLIKRSEDMATIKDKIDNENIIVKNKYDVVILDPPWMYGRKYDPATSRVASPYPEQTKEEIYKTCKDFFKDDCVLWLWTTHRFIWEAKELLEMWGFEYKAILVWDKEKMGMGKNLRMQCEFCLLGKKGNPLWNLSNERDIIREGRREHSRKPEMFYELIRGITHGTIFEYYSRKIKEGVITAGVEDGKY